MILKAVTIFLCHILIKKRLVEPCISNCTQKLNKMGTEITSWHNNNKAIFL